MNRSYSATQPSACICGPATRQARTETVQEVIFRLSLAITTHHPRLTSPAHPNEDSVLFFPSRCFFSEIAQCELVKCLMSFIIFLFIPAWINPKVKNDCEPAVSGGEIMSTRFIDDVPWTCACSLLYGLYCLRAFGNDRRSFVVNSRSDWLLPGFVWARLWISHGTAIAGIERFRSEKNRFFFLAVIGLGVEVAAFEACARRHIGKQIARVAPDSR